jgi:hypothetical protein
MPISFEAWPTRNVPTVGEARWTVQIHRAGAWPGWRWLDRLDKGMSVGSGGFILAVIALTFPLPSMAWRRLRYRTTHRSDWDVLVYKGEALDYSPRDAVLIVNLPTKAATVQRADHLWAFLSDQDRLPDTDEQ